MSTESEPVVTAASVDTNGDEQQPAVTADSAPQTETTMAPTENHHQSSEVASSKQAAQQRKKCLLSLSRKGTESLKELVTCAICLDRMHRPKMLPCQHTFCLLCLQNCIVGGTDSSGTSKVRCAQCRVETVVPKEGVSAFPVNIYLQSILDLLESDYASIDEFIRCLGCQTICDVSLCEHCSNSYCALCFERHLDDLKKQMAQISDQLATAAEKIVQRTKDFEITCGQVKTDIHHETEERIKKIQETECHLMQSIDKAIKEEYGTWKQVIQKIEAVSGRVQDSIQKGFDILGSSSDKVFLFLQLHRESADILSDVTTLGQSRLTFDKNSFSITIERKAESFVEEDSVNGNSNGNVIPASKTVTDDTRQRETENAQSRLYRAKTFMPKLRLGIGLLQRPSGVAVSPWSNEILVVAMDNHRVHVFDLLNGRFTRSFGSRGQQVGEFLCPFGVAMSSVSQQILVTDKWKHCIHVFDRDGNFLQQIGSKGRSPGHFRSPESICVDQEGRIYVCDTCNDRIQVLDKDGGFLHEIGVHSFRIQGGGIRQRSMFHEPTGIAVTRDGQRVIVCDFGNHRIHVFSSSGEHLSTFGQKGMSKGQFIHPECVAVDNRGFIFVGDSGNGRVQICRPDGRFVRMFGNKGSSSGQFSWISDIAITDNYEVVVSDFKNHCVQIF